MRDEPVPGSQSRLQPPRSSATTDVVSLDDDDEDMDEQEEHEYEYDEEE